MDENFFNRGETIEQFIDDMQNNRDVFELLLSESRIDQVTIGRLPDGLNVMVIAEDWSGDVLYNVPVLIRMARDKGWNVRIFRRDQFPELILPYRKDGLYHSIPVFVFYDEDFNELGNWIERPSAATSLIDEESLKLRRRLREEHKDEWRRQTINEITNLLKTNKKRR